MAEFGLTQLTIPTPQPYNDKKPTQQLENLCYVALQMIAQAKQAGFVIRENQATVLDVNLTGVETKLEELKWNTVVLDLWPLGKIYGQYHGPAVREG